MQEPSALNFRPDLPYEGEVSEVEISFFCNNYPSTNLQGMDSFVEFSEPNIISLHLVYDNTSDATFCTPSPPYPTYYKLGFLAEGVYQLQIYRQPVGVILPTQNDAPDFTTEFLVRGGSEVVNTFSTNVIILLAVIILLSTFCFNKFKHRKNSVFRSGAN